MAEVKRFNDWSDTRASEALALIKIARAAGAEAVRLIPRNDKLGMGNGERQAALRMALKALRPMLEDHGLVGMVEPLGFAQTAMLNGNPNPKAIFGDRAMDLPVLVPVLAGLGCDLLAGIVNGALIACIRIPPFIPTLGMMVFACGMSRWWWNGNPVSFPTES